MNVISEALREFEIFCQFVELSLPAKTFGIVTYKNENRERGKRLHIFSYQNSFSIFIWVVLVFCLLHYFKIIVYLLKL